MKGHVPPSVFFGSTSFNEPTARNISGVKAGQAGPDSRFARTKHTLISCQFNISSSPSSSLPSSPFFSTALSFFYFSFSFFLSILSHSLFHIIPSILRHFLPLPCIIRPPLPSFHSLFHFNKVSSAKDLGKVDTAQSHFSST